MKGNKKRKLTRNSKALLTFMRNALIFVQLSNCQEYRSNNLAHSIGFHCLEPYTNYFINGFARRGTTFAFYIDSGDINKLTALSINGQDRTQLVSRGSDCYTYSDSNRINRFGLFWSTTPRMENISAKSRNTFSRRRLLDSKTE